MKKFVTLFLSTVLVFCMVACGNSKSISPTSDESLGKTESSQESTAVENITGYEESSQIENKENKKSLVVYFSMPETTDAHDMSQEEANSVVVVNGEVLGNTQYVAYIIRDNTGADIFRIEPENPYPTDHETLIDLAAEEQEESARPVIKEHVENMEQYDTVYVGYPNWWGDMPMILYSFFDEYDLSGKTIIPFNTHGGSGFSNTISTITDLEPGAYVDEEGFTVSRDHIEDVEDDVIAWLEEKNLG